MTDEKDIAKILSDKEIKGKAWDLKARELGFKPGQLVPGTQSWVRWVKEDLDPTKTVTFLAQDVLGTQGGNYYDGHDKFFIIDLNGLTCRIDVGKVNTINEFFYSRYEQMVNGNIALEEFKRKGPKVMGKFWNWSYQPNTPTFGMDIDGRYLRDPEWYEFDGSGIPIKINNIKKIATLVFSGDLELNFTKQDVLRLIYEVYKGKLLSKINKVFGRKNDNKKSQRRATNGRGNKAK